MQALEIEEQEAGSRLDRVLCERLGLSRAEAKRLFAGGEVRRNGRRADKGELVARGDRIELGSELSDPRARPDFEVPFRVVFEDASLVVVDKPAGVPCHPLRPGEMGCLANGLVAHYPEMAQVGYDLRQPGLVNRLDNDTSGLVLAARSAPAFSRLRAMLEQGELHKTYLALVERAVPAQSIDLALSPSSRHRARVEVSALGRPANSIIERSWPHGHFYIVQVRAPKAYRHQVRAHLAAVGAPIVGDHLYGGSEGVRHYLHAFELRLWHPISGETLELRAELPRDWPE
ncbi:MAG TPA: RluA family pseudouridine synthase [Polyangiales bacterium]